jgi:hypothetical protein
MPPPVAQKKGPPPPPRRWSLGLFNDIQVNLS